MTQTGPFSSRLTQLTIYSPEISVHGLEKELVAACLLLAQNDLKVSQFDLRRWKWNFH